MKPRLSALRALAAAATLPRLGLGCQVIADVDADRLTSSASTSSGATTTTGTGGQGGQGGQGGASSTGTGGEGGRGGHGGEAGGGGEAGAGGMAPCQTAADCPAPENPCQTATCAAGACGTGNVPAGVPSALQKKGDCQQSLCNGSGAAVDSPVFNDPFDDGEECTDDFCSAGAPLNTPASTGQPCSQNGGTWCDGAGSCVVCLSDADCPGTTPSCFSSDM